MHDRELREDLFYRERHRYRVVPVRVEGRLHLFKRAAGGGQLQTRRWFLNGPEMTVLNVAASAAKNEIRGKGKTGTLLV